MHTTLTIGLKRLRAAMLVALFAPFLAVQTIAQGVMPTAGPDGIAMVLCTGETLVEVVLLPDGTIAPAKDEHAGVHCPWAISNVAGVEPVTTVAPELTALEGHAEPAPVRFSARVSDILRTPPARGPPFLG